MNRNYRSFSIDRSVSGKWREEIKALRQNVNENECVCVCVCVCECVLCGKETPL